MLQQLKQHARFQSHWLNIYGNPKCPLSFHLQVLFRGVHLSEGQKYHHKANRSVRVSLKWLLGKVKSYSKFINFKQMQKTGMSLVGKVITDFSLL